MRDPRHGSAGAWAKKCYFASRALMESILRPYELGSTQWYVLYQLASEGPTRQRDLVRMLQIERATMSEVVGALVRKGLVDQTPDPADQRQRTLRITPPGRQLWETLPDPIATIQAVAFAGIDEAKLATVVEVLSVATLRLNNHLHKESES